MSLKRSEDSRRNLEGDMMTLKFSVAAILQSLRKGSLKIGDVKDLLPFIEKHFSFKENKILVKDNDGKEMIF